MLPVIFDIETGGLPDDQLRAIVPPFDSSSIKHPGEFDPTAVKYGNTKDEAKRAAKLADEQQRHARAVESYSDDLVAAERAYYADQTSRAALSALTGEVLAIGYRGEKTAINCVGQDSTGQVITEATIIARFWSQYKSLRKAGRKMIGFNIAFFDIPFLVQRSWILGVNVPDSIYTVPSRYLESQTFIDLAHVWAGSQRNGFVKLDTIAKAMGLTGKPNGTTGADFARLFHNPETRREAIEYLIGDLDITFNVAERCGLT